MKAVVRSDNVIILFECDVTQDDIDAALRNVDEMFDELVCELEPDTILVFEGCDGGFVRFLGRIRVLKLC